MVSGNTEEITVEREEGFTDREVDVVYAENNEELQIAMGYLRDRDLMDLAYDSCTPEQFAALSLKDRDYVFRLCEEAVYDMAPIRHTMREEEYREISESTINYTLLYVNWHMGLCEFIMKQISQGTLDAVVGTD